MQGNIIISTKNSNTTVTCNQDNLAQLIAQLTEKNSSLTKLTFDSVSAQPEELAPLLTALKTNRSVLEIQFNHCQLDRHYLEYEVTSLIKMPIEDLMKATPDQLTTATDQTEPQNMINALMTSRNYILRQVSIDGNEIQHMGLEINKTLGAWHPSFSSPHDQYRFIASYYLSIANQFYAQKQMTNAINYAAYGNMMLKQIPVDSQIAKDQQLAVKFAILLGDLFAKKDLREQAEKRYAEANLIEQNAPENKRTDDNWRNLLYVQSLLAKITDKHKAANDTTNCFHTAVSALYSFCRIKNKMQSDYILAANSAKLIADIGSATATFIYLAIFDTTNTRCNLNETIDAAKQELRGDSQKKMRHIFIELLIFILNAHESNASPTQRMKEYLQSPENKQTLETALIDITQQHSCGNQETQESVQPDDAAKPKKAPSSYLTYFFGLKNTYSESHAAAAPYKKPAI